MKMKLKKVLKIKNGDKFFKELKKAYLKDVFENHFKSIKKEEFEDYFEENLKIEFYKEISKKLKKHKKNKKENKKVLIEFLNSIK